MAMGTGRRRRRQEPLWVGHQELAQGPVHPFYDRVNELLEAEQFDEFAEKECAKFYAENNGRPSLTPGIYFRLMLVGYFEGIDSEREIAWRTADSLGLRKFLEMWLDERTPDHSTISRTRRLIDVETHQQVFLWILERLRDRGLVKGKTVGIDATTLEANAAMRSMVRRDTGESYEIAGNFCGSFVEGEGLELPHRRSLLSENASFRAGVALVSRPRPSSRIHARVRRNSGGAGTDHAGATLRDDPAWRSPYGAPDRIADKRRPTPACARRDAFLQGSMQRRSKRSVRHP
jgi:transposase